MSRDDRIQRAIKTAIRDGVLEAIQQLRQKLKKLDAEDPVGQAIENIMPGGLDGAARVQLKAKIRERLKEEDAIK